MSPDTIVPDPGNPQSFNRYSYGYNNPVKYFDPSGHIACDVLGTEDCVQDADGNNTANYALLDMPTEARRQYLAEYTDFLLRVVRNPQAGITDVEIIARVMEAASGFNTTVREWADDITSVVNGTTGLFTLLTAISGDQAPQFGDTGFHAVYRDNQNQVYHWWAYVNSAVQGGEFGANVLGYIGNEVHEFWDFREVVRQPASGSSWADYALSENGMAFGLGLHYGNFSPQEAGDVARWALATDLRRPIVRWMSENIGDAFLPPNVIREGIEHPLPPPIIVIP
ncbi:MAG: hypothetical protein IT327_31955 [Anaerolineae bacterium]|nr:hypothetical protein [Anaerolineae bacterium]